MKYNIPNRNRIRRNLRRFMPVLILLAALGIYEATRLSMGPPGPKGDGESRSPGEAEESVAAEITAEAAEEEAGAAEPSGDALPAEGTVSRGSSFFDEMRRAGVSPSEIHDVVAASRPAYNLKKIRPGQKFTIYAGEGGRLDSLDFVIDLERRLKVTRSPTGFVARMDTASYALEHYLTSGGITQSVFVSLQERGADPELAGRLAVIFQWDIDFFTDIRRGDQFTILYEKKIFEDGRSALGRVLAAKVRTRGREHHALGYREAGGSWEHYDVNGKSLQKSLLRAPLRYTRVTSNFSYRRYHPVTRSYRPHLGVDYGAPRGTPVYSTGDGTVVAATRDGGNGNYIKIRHNNRYSTYYLHLSRFGSGIRAGRKVRQGQLIGYVGSTGLATAPHLDYRIKVDGRFVNPRTIKLPSRTPVPPGEMAQFEKIRDSYLLTFFMMGSTDRTVFVEYPQLALRSRMRPVF